MEPVNQDRRCGNLLSHETFNTVTGEHHCKPWSGGAVRRAVDGDRE